MTVYHSMSLYNTIYCSIIIFPVVIICCGYSMPNILLSISIRTTRKTGGLLTGYKPVVLGQRLKALAFTTFKPHSH